MDLVLSFIIFGLALHFLYATILIREEKRTNADLRAALLKALQERDAAEALLTAQKNQRLGLLRSYTEAENASRLFEIQG